jgi:hypothetical protein
MQITQTRAERLDALLQKVAARAHAHQAEHGVWPHKETDSPDAPEHRRRAPYVRETLADGRIRLRITTDDGDVVSGVGATTDEALTMLEAKIG